MKKREYLDKYPKKIFCGATFAVFLVAMLFKGLFAQSVSDLRLEKAALKERLEYLEKEMNVEGKELEVFRGKKEKLLNQKKRERELVLKEVSTREAEIASYKNQVMVVQKQKKRIQEEDKKITNFLEKNVKQWMDELEEGIPFQKKNRKSVLSRLFYDMKGSRIGVMEAYSRFISFFDKEIEMGYDSQVVKAVVDVDGKKVSGSLLRLGRIYFIFDTGDDIYRFIPNADGKGYSLTKDSFSLAEKNAVRNIVDMVEGRMPPDLVILDVPVKKVK